MSRSLWLHVTNGVKEMGRTMARNARHMTLAVFDIEGFGARNDADQKWLRDQMLELLKLAAKRADVPWQKCRLIDRGDGVALLVPASVSKETVANAFVREVLVGQRAHNRRCHGPAAMRMRLALHAGEVERGGKWMGGDRSQHGLPTG